MSPPFAPRRVVAILRQPIFPESGRHLDDSPGDRQQAHPPADTLKTNRQTTLTRSTATVVCMLLLCAALFSCEQPSSGRPDGGDQLATADDDAGTSQAHTGALELRVNNAVVIKTREQTTDQWSKTVAYLSITLANEPGTPDVPLNTSLFAISTTSGTRKSMASGYSFSDPLAGDPYELSSFLDTKPCDSSLSLVGGAAITCGLAATFDGDVDFAEVQYRTPGAIAGEGADRRSAMARINAAQCTPCGWICTNVQRDVHHCGSCENDAEEANARCVAGIPTCSVAGRTFCALSGRLPSCSDLLTDEGNCGMCGNSVYSGVCEGGQPKCSGTDTQSCGLRNCISKEETANCGACGKSCKLLPQQGLSCKLAPGGAYLCATARDGAKANVKETCDQACTRSGFEACLAAELYYEAGTRYPKACTDTNPAGTTASWNCTCGSAPL